MSTTWISMNMYWTEMAHFLAFWHWNDGVIQTVDSLFHLWRLHFPRCSASPPTHPSPTTAPRFLVTSSSFSGEVFKQCEYIYYCWTIHGKMVKTVCCVFSHDTKTKRGRALDWEQGRQRGRRQHCDYLKKHQWSGRGVAAQVIGNKASFCNPRGGPWWWGRS